MPINATAEYYIAEKRYLESRTKEEKIAALEEMISALPKHKGTHNLLAQLKRRLAKLKSEKVSKATAKPKFIIKKEGAAQVCIIGLTQSGKSTLLNYLTNANAEVDNHPFTTQLPQVGMAFVDYVQIQLIEIPSTFDPSSISILRACDEILILLDKRQDSKEQKTELLKVLEDNNLLNKKYMFISNDYTKEKLEQLKKEIWKSLDLIKVYTKSPGKKKALPPIVLKPGSTVKDVVLRVHKNFLKTFRFARIFNDSKFSGRKVGLDYILEDEDTVEFHV